MKKSNLWLIGLLMCLVVGCSPKKLVEKPNEETTSVVEYYKYSLDEYKA